MTQAEGVADLIAAESKAEATVALHHLKGGISAEIAALRDQLVHFASMLELELDFGEEEVEFADRQQLTQLLDTANARIQILLTLSNWAMPSNKASLPSSPGDPMPAKAPCSMPCYRKNAPLYPRYQALPETR
ncbi:MAG: hypothetical protein IPP04_02980 [Saprospiraceae bacterium]|nr:hypothetical protein [Saprospiraceae bacterium]